MLLFKKIFTKIIGWYGYKLVSKNHIKNLRAVGKKSKYNVVDFITYLSKGRALDKCDQVVWGGGEPTLDKSFEQIFPNNGWVEHNPEEIIKTVISCCNEVIENNSDKNICSIGITNQRETIVLWDKLTGKSLYNAIVWQDRRTESFCRDLKEEGHEELIINKVQLNGIILKPNMILSGNKSKDNMTTTAGILLFWPALFFYWWY